MKFLLTISWIIQGGASNQESCCSLSSLKSLSRQHHKIRQLVHVSSNLLIATCKVDCGNGIAAGVDAETLAHGICWLDMLSPCIRGCTGVLRDICEGYDSIKTLRCTPTVESSSFYKRFRVDSSNSSSYSSSSYMQTDEAQPDDRLIEWICKVLSKLSRTLTGCACMVLRSIDKALLGINESQFAVSLRQTHCFVVSLLQFMMDSAVVFQIVRQFFEALCDSIHVLHSLEVRQHSDARIDDISIHTESTATSVSVCKAVLLSQCLAAVKRIAHVLPGPFKAQVKSLLSPSVLAQVHPSMSGTTLPFASNNSSSSNAAGKQQNGSITSKVVTLDSASQWNIGLSFICDS
jgi:hypothetical protein